MANEAQNEMIQLLKVQAGILTRLTTCLTAAIQDGTVSTDLQALSFVGTWATGANEVLDQAVAAAKEKEK